MKITVENEEKSCLLFHSWDTICDGTHSACAYKECKDCGARQIIFPKSYTLPPADYEWLKLHD